MRANAWAGSIVLVMIALLPAAVRGGEASGVWRSDYKAALEEAKRDDKLMLLHFHAHWCGPCQQMERTVLNTSRVSAELSNRVIAVKIDVDAHPELRDQFGIQSMPTDLFVDSSERILTPSVGKRTEDEYIALLTEVGTRFENTKRIRLLRSMAGRDLAPKVEHHVAGFRPSEVVNAAMDGYCPVTLRKTRDWVEGTSEFQSEYQGVTFFLTSAENKVAFEADPSRYVPRLLGCDPVAMWESDRAVAGTTDFGAFYNGELYLFVTRENRDLFKVDPERYARLRHVRAEDIEFHTVFR